MFYLSFNSEDPIFGDGVKGVVVGVSVVVSGTAVDSVVVVSLRFGGGGGGEVVMIWSLGGCVGGFDLTATFGIVAVSLETLKSV